MTQVEESYEHIRKLFSSGFATRLPKHELTYNLIKNMYHDEEALMIFSSFKEINEFLTVDQINEKSGIKDKKKLKEMNWRCYIFQKSNKPVQ